MSGEEEIIIIRGGKQIARYPSGQAAAGLRELADALDAEPADSGEESAG